MPPFERSPQLCAGLACIFGSCLKKADFGSKEICDKKVGQFPFLVSKFSSRDSVEAALPDVMYTKREARSPFFTKRLAYLRRSKNLSLETLAKAVGVSAVQVFKWEKGETYPKAEHLERLAEALDSIVDDLTGAEGARHLEQLRSKDTDRSVLSEVVEAARRRIAEAAGLPVPCIRVLIDLSILNEGTEPGDEFPPT